ncbi:MAG: S-layer homology domain-containing protein [Oscillospiraceae bacterium]|nr:S-layer homology domain-containing protein [Oscillospiraceae bacterium]
MVISSVINTYYAPAVEWALKNEVTGGTTTATFSPNTGCTRAQIVTFLWRAAGCPEPAGMSSFTDVSADAYYAKAVAWAAEQGITGGTGDGKFSPDAVCTRSQSMTFIYRSEQAQGGGMQGEWMFQNPFADVNLEDYYGEAVMWAVANGVTSGTSDTTFSPNATCTRGQIVTFLYRAYQGE